MQTLSATLPAPRPASLPSPLPFLMKAVWLQAIRRSEIFVLAILLGLYLLGALIIRIVGMESVQAVRFVGGIGFQLGALLSALLAILLGARQIPQDLELRTIYPILAKPVTRGQVIAGKALSTWLASVVAMGLFALVTLAVVPHIAFQNPLALAQALVLRVAALGVVTILVICVSLWMGTILAALTAGGIYFGAGYLGNFVIQSAHGARWAHYASGLLPDFTLLDQLQRYVDGGAPLAAGTFIGLLAMAGVWAWLLSWAALARFRAMAL